MTYRRSMACKLLILRSRKLIPDRLLAVVPSLTVLAFATFALARHPLVPTSDGSCRLCNEAGKFAFATARLVACPTPSRAFTFELSSCWSPRQNVEYNYTATTNYRGRTFTCYKYSLVGCKQRHKGTKKAASRIMIAGFLCVFVPLC